MPQWLEYIVFFVVLVAFLCAFVFWVWGTVHPRSLNKTVGKGKGVTRKQAFFGGAVATFALFVLAGTTGSWATGPTFELAGFQNERAFTDAAQYVINGSTFDQSAKLTVNGKPLTIDSAGDFKITEKLRQGDNQYKIAIENSKGDRQNSETVTIHRTTDAEFAARKAHRAAVLAAKTVRTPSPSPKSTATASPSPSATPAKTATPTPKPVARTVVRAPTPRPAAPAPAAPAPAPAKPACDPNYAGACVPNVYPADVDCAGGSGNGPYYVQGPVQVIGTDIYGLDSNHDGWGCTS